MPTLPACIPCVASAAAAGSAMTACASSGVYLSSAQLGSSPPRWSSSRATMHTQSHTNHIHLFCILIHHPPRCSPHLSWSKGSEMMHRIGVDSCTRVSSGWPLHQSHFPPYPAATVPGEPGELPPVPARSIPYSNPPPSLEVIAPTLDAPGSLPQDHPPWYGSSQPECTAHLHFSVPPPCRARPGGHRPRQGAGSVHVHSTSAQSPGYDRIVIDPHYAHTHNERTRDCVPDSRGTVSGGATVILLAAVITNTRSKQARPGYA